GEVWRYGVAILEARAGPPGGAPAGAVLRRRGKPLDRFIAARGRRRGAGEQPRRAKRGLVGSPVAGRGAAERGVHLAPAPAAVRGPGHGRGVLALGADAR